MKSHPPGRGSRRPRRGGSRRRFDGRREGVPSHTPSKKTLWQRFTALFGNGNAAIRSTAAGPARNASPVRSARKPEAVEVTTPRLYVGNLSFDATESDLFELFNGVGKVQNAEIVSNKYTQKSKGFAFVTLQSIDEARRAVAELHDKEFLGRKLVVSGAKSSEHQSRN